MVKVGMDLKAHLIPPSAMGRDTFQRPGCSKPCPAWAWTHEFCRIPFGINQVPTLMGCCLLKQPAGWWLWSSYCALNSVKFDLANLCQLWSMQGSGGCGPHGFIPNHHSGICLPEFVVNALKSAVDVQDNLEGKSWRQIRLGKLKQGPWLCQW